MKGLFAIMDGGRRVFSLCPCCQEVHRLSDLQLHKKGAFRPDWYDQLARKEQRAENAYARLEERAADLRRAAKERAERTELPRLLRERAPFFWKRGIDPRDVRILCDPIEYVAFNGMNSPSGVSSVTLLQSGDASGAAGAIEEAVRRRNVGWSTIQVADDGSVVPPVAAKGEKR